MSAPDRTPEQRAQALAAARAVRQERALLRAALKSGATDGAALIAQSGEDDTWHGVRVRWLLESLPGIGPVRAAALMERAGIAPSRRLGGLSQRQRAAIAAAVASRRPALSPLVVVSGPSGVGKSTVVRAALELVPEAWLSVSTTTRPARPGEVDGRDYFFVSDEEFTRMQAQGELLESATFAGNRYGTPRGPVAEHRAAGHPVLLEIEVQGARQVRASAPDAVLVFLAPPSWEVLKQRLVGRGTETDDSVARRLQHAEDELAAQGEFDAVVVNTDVREAAESLVGFLA